ncbi:MAG: alpha/beta fold hydrolase [Desulfuromonadales bacterium]|nr:alpha/beta fold hydrolase [Desulfuromonadales bacterium]
MARQTRWLELAAVAVGAAVSWRVLQARRERRLLLEQGDIRELESAWAEVDDCRIHGRVSAAAAEEGVPPVVLIHGWGVAGTYFLPTAERLAAAFAVYLPDLPGHGRSDTPPEPLDIAGLARALLGWMKAVGIKRASLVGHSMGCQIAVEAALQEPSLVDRLVLIGPTPDPAARSAPHQFRRFLLGGLHERLSLSLHLALDYGRMGGRLAPEFGFMLADRIEDKLPKVQIPTLLVRGEKDTMVPQRWLEEAAHLLPTAEVAVIPGWGHAVQYSAPKALVQAIHPFLRRAGRETGS